MLHPLGAAIDHGGTNTWGRYGHRTGSTIDRDGTTKLAAPIDRGGRAAEVEAGGTASRAANGIGERGSHTGAPGLGGTGIAVKGSDGLEIGRVVGVELTQIIGSTNPKGFTAAVVGKRRSETRCTAVIGRRS